MKKTTIALISVPLWLLNPMFTGCAEDDKFQFGEAEMLDLLDTLDGQTWVTTIDGTNHELILDLQQATEVQASLTPNFLTLGSALACGDRTFLASAEACVETSTLHIEGTVSVVNLDTQVVLHESLEIEGSMTVIGYVLDNADINLYHESGSLYWYSSDGQSIELESTEW